MTPATTMTEMLSVSILAVAAGLTEGAQGDEPAEHGEASTWDESSASATDLCLTVAALEEALERG